MNKQKKGNLYLIPTPLAENTLDKMVTADLKNVIKNTNHYLVENIRTSRRFISSLKLNIVIEKLDFKVLDKKTSTKDINRLCAPLLKGQDVGILSEAGCPGVADPGNLAVSYAHQYEIKVIPLVGPSSIFMALMGSGLNGQNFAFHGYLPIDKQSRAQAIQALEKGIITNKNQTQIFMETPYRNNHVLADLLRVCRSHTRLCIAKNVTGADEMITTKSIKEWRKIKIDLHKIPVIFLIN